MNENAPMDKSHTLHFYKALGREGRALSGNSSDGEHWHLPQKNDNGTWKPGRWITRSCKWVAEEMRTAGPASTCELIDLLAHGGEVELYDAELDCVGCYDRGNAEAREASVRVRLMCPAAGWNIDTFLRVASDAVYHAIDLIVDSGAAGNKKAVNMVSSSAGLYECAVKAEGEGYYDCAVLLCNAALTTSASALSFVRKTKSERHNACKAERSWQNERLLGYLEAAVGLQTEPGGAVQEHEAIADDKITVASVNAGFRERLANLAVAVATALDGLSYCDDQNCVEGVEQSKVELDEALANLAATFSVYAEFCKGMNLQMIQHDMYHHNRALLKRGNCDEDKDNI